MGDNNLEAAHLKINTSGTGALKFNDNSYLDFDLFGGSHGGDIINSYSDQLDIVGSLNVGNNVQLVVSTSTGITDWVEGDTWQLINWNDVAKAERGNDFEFVDNTGVGVKGLTWDLTNLYTTGSITLVVVPEPARSMLLLVGVMAGLMRCRRR